MDSIVPISVSKSWVRVIESFSAVLPSFGEVSSETSFVVDLQLAFRASYFPKIFATAPCPPDRAPFSGPVKRLEPKEALSS